MTTATPVADKMADQIKSAAEKAGLDVETLSADARRRALAYPAGLTGEALAKYIVEGDGLKEQTEKAAAERNGKAKRGSKRGGESKPGAPRSGVGSTGKAKPKGTTRKDGMSALDAAVEVLKHARRPLTPNEITDKILERKLAPNLGGKTPAATVGARLAVAAKAGKLVRRPEPGKYEVIR